MSDRPSVTHNHHSLSRREVISLGASAATTAWIKSTSSAAEASTAAGHIATNTYPWRTFAKRAGREYQRHTDKMLKDIASTGIRGYEPIIESTAEFDGLGERLQRHGLEMRSIYVNSLLHDAAKADASAEQVVAIASAARNLGVSVVVTNPSPIRWGGPEDKNDQQLRFQAGALNELGKTLRELGVTLAYHNHDAELRQGAREFHHMLTATSADNVKLCLDSHWIYRGCGNSEVAVFDALEHYHQRIVELHLRQSMGGTWTEAFSIKGDIDYERLFGFLATRRITPHLVLEQAIEDDSSNQMTVTQAHRKGCENLARSLS